MELGRPLPRRHTVTHNRLTGLLVGAGTIRADSTRARKSLSSSKNTHAHSDTQGTSTPTTLHTWVPPTPHRRGPASSTSMGAGGRRAGARTHAHSNTLAQPHGLVARCMRAAWPGAKPGYCNSSGRGGPVDTVRFAGLAGFRGFRPPPLSAALAAGPARVPGSSGALEELEASLPLDESDSSGDGARLRFEAAVQHEAASSRSSRSARSRASRTRRRSLTRKTNARAAARIGPCRVACRRALRAALRRFA